MFTVAIVGPDGAGKTTLARQLERSLPFPAKYLYMSINPASGNHLLPTTRLAWLLRGCPDNITDRDGRTRSSSRLRGMARTAVTLANQIAEEAYRFFLAARHVRRGTVVLFDRHYFFDYYATDIVGADRRKAERLHGFFLSRAAPQPDLTLYLDAPAEVLFARKHEGTVTSLGQLRSEFLEVARSRADVVVLDATRPIDEVGRQARTAICDFAVTRGARHPGVPGMRRPGQRSGGPPATS